LQVAALAGVPQQILGEAKRHLRRLEEQRIESPQLGLFGPQTDDDSPLETSSKPDLLRERLIDIDPDQLSPRDALTLLYELRQLLNADDDSAG
jgi:DNA mismatch repair protein MutS